MENLDHKARKQKGTHLINPENSTRSISSIFESKEPDQKTELSLPADGYLHYAIGNIKASEETVIHHMKTSLHTLGH